MSARDGARRTGGRAPEGVGLIGAVAERLCRRSAAGAPFARWLGGRVDRQQQDRLLSVHRNDAAWPIAAVRLNENGQVAHVTLVAGPDARIAASSLEPTIGPGSEMTRLHIGDPRGTSHEVRRGDYGCSIYVTLVPDPGKTSEPLVSEVVVRRDGRVGPDPA